MNLLYKFSIRLFLLLSISLLTINLYSQNIVVRSNNLNTYYEYIDNQSGEVISHYYYDQANPFIEGIARVSRNGLWGYIDKTGHNYTPFIFDSVDELTDEPSYIFGKINQMKLFFWKPTTLRYN
jgi:hypothetical protein